MIGLGLWASLALSASVWAPHVPEASEPAELHAVVAKADALYATRDQMERSLELLGLLREASRQWDKAYDVHWRMSRIAFWLAEGEPQRHKRRALAREGWEAGKKAVAANPHAAEGHYFLALSVGEYAASVSVLTAAHEGLEAKFREPLLRAARLDPRVDNGGPYICLGRYKYELPWPWRDLDASVAYENQALQIHPESLEARVYLAESLAARGKPGDVDQARQLLQAALDAPVGLYDAPEEMRTKVMARDALQKLAAR